jgi:hypothetical protein
MLFPKIRDFEYTPPHATELNSSAGRFSHRLQFRSMVATPLPTSRLLENWFKGTKEHCMFNKFAFVVAGLMLSVSSVGCCLCSGMGYGTGYGSRCAPCNNGCSPAGAGGGYIPSTGQLYQGDMSQAAFAPVGGYGTQQAFAPMQTATVIQGAPIYQQAIVPVNSLPTY